MISKTCEECGRRFEVYPYRAKEARFCSRECFGEWSSRHIKGKSNSQWKGGKVEKTCEQCGAIFQVHQYRKQTAKFCSIECKAEWMKDNTSGKENPNWKSRLEKTCRQCRGLFYVRQSLQYRKFCSVECYGEWLSENRSGKNHHQWGDREEKSCKNCKTSFLVSGWNSEQVFCSRECKDKYQTGKKSPAWRGGLSFIPYTPNFNASFKGQIRERDRYTCAICRSWANNIHHIDYDKTNSVPRNCITLCNSCHSTTNFNREYWQRNLKAIINTHYASSIVPLATIRQRYEALVELRFE